MGRMDSQRLAHEAFPAGSTSPAEPGLPPPQGEPVRGTTRPDGADGYASGWEAAWIDLGGEG